MQPRINGQKQVTRSRRTVVTGGAGFIGSHVCDSLLLRGDHVICVDNLFSGSLRNVRPLLNHPHFSFLEHDVSEPLEIDGGVDRIYNLACPASPRHYQRDPIGTMKTCIIGTMNMLELARQKSARLLQASTSEVYGDPEVHPQPESYVGHVNAIGPRACYDEGKRAAETLIFDYHRLYGLEVKVARIFNTYGPRMLENDGRVVSNFIVQALRGEPVTVYGQGTQTRSFCFVDDLVRGLELLMESPTSFTGPCNLGNPHEITIEAIAREVLASTHSASPLRFEPLPEDDPKRRKPVIEIALRSLGWRPTVTLKDGLKATSLTSCCTTPHRSWPWRHAALTHDGRPDAAGFRSPANDKKELEMQIAVLGTGYVGLVSAACFAHAGQHVTCVDIDETKISLLRRGKVPIYEQGLHDLIAEGRRRRRLHFVSQAAAAVSNADIVFIAVGTPTRASDGHADLSQVYAAVEGFAPSLKAGTIVVTKSTVPVGTADLIEHLIRSICPELEFEVASNPEFLRAGQAVADFLRPDRVVIGAEGGFAAARLRTLYRSVGIENERILLTDRRSSELIKYAANGFLATKIAFINEVADLCEKVDARIGDVARGIGLDERIGIRYLRPGPGFGGSCFPKDARALVKMGEDHEAPMRIMETVLASNEARKRSMARKIAAICGGSVRGKTIALLGLTFKADTDDMREAVSIPLAQALVDAGGSLTAYDPVATERAKALLPQCVRYCSSIIQAAEDADAIVIVTEWRQFAEIDFRTLRRGTRSPIIIDLRNFLNEKQVQRGGFKYFSIGGPRRRALETVWRQARSEKLPSPHDSKWATDCESLGEQIAAAE